MTTTTFTQQGGFAATRAAEAWCKRHGLSVGFMQRNEPRGLLYGDYAIAKWRNLSIGNRAALDGTMTGNTRHGPITVTLAKDPS